MRSNFIAINAAAIGAFYSVKKFAEGTVNTTAELESLHAQTGLSIESLQKFGRMAEMSDLTMNSKEAIASLVNLEKTRQKVLYGMESNNAFNMLGVDPSQNVFQILNRIKTQMKNLPQSIQGDLLSQMGLDPRLVSVLHNVNSEFNQFSQNDFLNGKQRADVMALGYSFRNLTFVLKNLKDKAVAEIAPQLKQLTNDFFKWIVANKTKIVDTMKGIAMWFAEFAKAIGNAAGLLGNFIEKITGSTNGMKVLAMAGVLLTLSFKPILAMLAGVILLLDDIAVWKSGGDSLFGGLYDALSKIPNLEKILGGGALLMFLGKLTGSLGGVVGSLEKIGKGSKLIRGLSAFGLLAAGEALDGIADKKEDGFGKDAMKTGSAGLMGAGIGSLFGPYGALIGGIMGVLAKEIQEWNKLGVFNDIKTNTADLFSNGVFGGGNSSTNNNVTNNVNINVNGAKDPEAVADEVIKRQTELQNANARFHTPER
jgi:hypothetical protein